MFDLRRLGGKFSLLVKLSIGEIVQKAILAGGAGALIVILLTAGCGSSSSGSSSMTKAEFIEQGDAICKQADGRTKAEYEAFAKQHNIAEGQEPSQVQQRELVETIALPSIARQAKELGELDVPASEGAKASAVVEEVEKALKKAEAEPSVVIGNNSPFTAATKLAKEYGFKVCGQ
jgi:hypothetical protein